MTAVAPLIQMMEEQDLETRVSIAVSLIQLGEERGGAILKGFLDNQDTRQIAMGTFARTRDYSDQCLLSQDADSMKPWIDPRQIIGEKRVRKMALRLSMAPEDVRKRYESLAAILGLKFNWNLPLFPTP